MSEMSEQQEQREWWVEGDAIRLAAAAASDGNGDGEGSEGKGRLLRPWSIADVTSGLYTAEMHAALAEAARSERKSEGGQVCVCGHPIGRHYTDEALLARRPDLDATTCKPLRTVCWCTKPLAVLRTDDPRPFMRATHGIGGGTGGHALTRGLWALTAKGREWEWLPGQPQCAICEQVVEMGGSGGGGEIWPVVIDGVTQEVITNLRAAGVGPAGSARWRRLTDALVCGRCLAEKLPEAAAVLL